MNIIILTWQTHPGCFSFISSSIPTKPPIPPTATSFPSNPPGWPPPDVASDWMDRCEAPRPGLGTGLGSWPNSIGDFEIGFPWVLNFKIIYQVGCWLFLVTAFPTCKVEKQLDRRFHDRKFTHKPCLLPYNQLKCKCHECWTNMFWLHTCSAKISQCFFVFCKDSSWALFQ